MVDYDRRVNFAKFKTSSWGPIDTVDAIWPRVKDAIDSQLAAEDYFRRRVRDEKRVGDEPHAFRRNEERHTGHLRQPGPELPYRNAQRADHEEYESGIKQALRRQDALPHHCIHGEAA